MISLSIVSHGHGEHLRRLLDDIRRLARTDLEILLTLNSAVDQTLAGLPGQAQLVLLRNESPRGFAANHNAAFRASRGEHFCVLNPDVRIERDPFERLLAALSGERVGVAAPRVVGSDGSPQPSYRPVPTPRRLVEKALGIRAGVPAVSGPRIFPDWIAGMFMLFRRETFQAIGGFSERYFLYYEDVDICCRLWLAGYKVCVATDAVITHDGQYASRRNLRHLGWHTQSIWRFFRSPAYRQFISLARK